MSVFPTTTCLVATDTQLVAESTKVKLAKKYNVAIVNDHYIWDCVKRERRLDVFTLILDGKLRPTPEVDLDLF